VSTARSTLVVRGRSLPLPVFFPAVSSVKTALSPLRYLQFLSAMGAPQLLVSAYDYSVAGSGKVRFRELIGAIGAKSTVLVDSGNYEKFWLDDARWTKLRYENAVRALDAPIAFGFDNLKPPANVRTNVRQIETTCVSSQARFSATSVLPIVHGPRDRLPEIIRRVATRLRPMMIGVPERALGDGLFARALLVHQIRSALGELNTPLHVLGVGNPLSIAVYAAVGADSFDGLEWCQTVIRPVDATLHHFSHFDLMPAALEAEELGFIPAALFRNITFILEWMAKLQNVDAAGGLPGYALSLLPSQPAKRLRKAIPEVFA